ncbi:MAG TPA: cytochrome C oxidase subunit IV family protein [Polyangiaceae bacterium]|jgi:cytochrome c oxidase subunit 4
MAAEHSHAHVGHEQDHDHDDGGDVHVHIAPTRFYVGIFGALVCLTIATVKVSYYDFGSANILIALLIATMKASLVAAFFMHLRHDKLFNTVAFLAAFLFLGIFILLTNDDVGVRAKDIHGYAQKMNLESGSQAPGGEPATSATVNEAAGEGQEGHEGAPPSGSAGHEPKKE